MLRLVSAAAWLSVRCLLRAEKAPAEQLPRVRDVRLRMPFKRAARERPQTPPCRSSMWWIWSCTVTSLKWGLHIVVAFILSVGGLEYCFQKTGLMRVKSEIKTRVQGGWDIFRETDAA